MDPDDPDNYTDEAEDKETTDNERDDRESVPVVDQQWFQTVPYQGLQKLAEALENPKQPSEALKRLMAGSDLRSYGYRFGDFMGE